MTVKIFSGGPAHIVATDDGRNVTALCTAGGANSDWTIRGSSSDVRQHTPDGSLRLCKKCLKIAQKREVVR